MGRGVLPEEEGFPEGLRLELTVRVRVRASEQRASERASAPVD